jgi:uncharacterized protein YcfJ
MKCGKLVLAVGLLTGISACATWDKLDRTEQGAVIGAGSGALVGGAVDGGRGALIGGAGGGLAGGLIGREVEKRDDRDERRVY